MAQLETRLVATLVDKISGPANKAASALKNIGAATNQRVGGVFNSINRELGRTNRHLDQVRGRMVEAGIQAFALKKALEAPVLAYANFEKGLVGLGQKANRSLEEMTKIGAEIRNIAPGMHQSADALVGVMDTLVGAGVEFDVAKKSLGAISKASHAMNADIKSISDASVSFLQNMKIGADKLGEAWGIAAAAANAGKFELEDVAKQFPGVASFGAMRGMTGIEGERELLGILEGLSTRTATAEQAATQMRNILQKLDSQETTNRFSKAIEAENIRLQDAVKRHGKFDLGGTIMARARRMGVSQVRAFVDITQEMIAKGHGKVQLSDLISDAEFLSGMQNIIDGLRDIDSIIAETKKNSAGFLDKAQAEPAKTLSSKLADLSNAFSSLNIEIGTALAPMLGDITERLKGLTEWVRNLSAAHPNLIQNVTIAATAFVALNVGIVALRYSFLNLKIAALTTLAALGGWLAPLAALVAAVYLLYQRWD